MLLLGELCRRLQPQPLRPQLAEHGSAALQVGLGRRDPRRLAGHRRLLLPAVDRKQGRPGRDLGSQPHEHLGYLAAHLGPDACHLLGSEAGDELRSLLNGPFFHGADGHRGGLALSTSSAFHAARGPPLDRQPAAKKNTTAAELFAIAS